MSERQKQINAMRNLGMSDNEIMELLEEDNKIDSMKNKSEINNDLSKEQRKTLTEITREYSGKYEKSQERKEKEEQLRAEKTTALDFLMQGCENIETVKPGSECIFTYDNVKYRVVIKRVRKQ